MTTPSSTFSNRNFSMPILDIMDQFSNEIFLTQSHLLTKDTKTTVQDTVNENLTSSFSAKYVLTDQVLGRGGMSIVKKCIRRRDGKNFAVKVMDMKFNFEHAVEREIEALERVESVKYTIKMVESFSSTDYTYIILELCEGKDLFEWLLAESKFNVVVNETKMAYIFYQIIRGVHLCHKKYITHRDIKPENILFKYSDELEIVIADFGLANVGSDPMKSASGSPNYIAPEVILIRNGKTYDSRCDWWSCGVLLFVLLSRQYPFGSSKIQEVYKLILRAQYSFKTDRWKNISSDAKDLVTHLLKIDPKERYGYNQIMRHPFMKKNLKMKKKN